MRPGVLSRWVPDYGVVSDTTVMAGIILGTLSGWLVALLLLHYWAWRGPRSVVPKVVQVALLLALVCAAIMTADSLRIVWLNVGY
jgi:MFS family permease